MTSVEISRSIKTLKKWDLKTKQFSMIEQKVYRLFEKQPIAGTTPNTGYCVYRAREMATMPKSISELAEPPKSLITEYGRCNVPHSPVFYCSNNVETAITEISPKKPSEIYLSRWIAKRPIIMADPMFLLNQSPRQLTEKQKRVLGFITEEFKKIVPSGKNHQYKITAAVASKIMHGQISGNFPNYSNSSNAAERLSSDTGLGAMAYISVKHDHNLLNLNIAIHPDVRKKSFQFDGVEKIRVKPNGRIQRLDFADFSGDTLRWRGQPLKEAPKDAQIVGTLDRGNHTIPTTNRVSREFP